MASVQTGARSGSSRGSATASQSSLALESAAPLPPAPSPEPVEQEPGRKSAAPEPAEPVASMTKKRLTQLFEYLKAYSDLRYPAVRDIGDQPHVLPLHKLPAHPAVERVADNRNPDDESDDADVVLRLTRPAATPCPPPPAALADWLKPGWQEIEGHAEIQPTRQLTAGPDGSSPRPGAAARPERRTEAFDTAPARVSAFHSWRQQREEWMNRERPVRATLALFQQIYAWYGIQEREGERIELLIGDGILCCPDAAGEFRHPVLLQKLALEFYPERHEPQFVFRKDDHPPELYMEFLRSLPGVNTSQLARCADELKQAEFSPLGAEETDGFLRRLIQGLFPSSGIFADKLPPSREAPAAGEFGRPVIARQPVIFMRSRRTGPDNVFDLVLEDIEAREEFPASLRQILGLQPMAPDPQETPAAFPTGNEDEHILLSKPANREQLEIARQLARKDCVLVQGPPGTGKTHTIANLLGHLLAQGKRVLVTAHTPKALRVLRQKVVEPLQPLCISVLHNDKPSQEELQASVRRIHVRLGEDEQSLEQAAQRLSSERQNALGELREARQQLFAARQDEIRSLGLDGKQTRPVEAARRVKEGAGLHDWIPGPVTPGESLPLTPAEVVELYQTNARVSPADERALRSTRPELGALPSPGEFRAAMDALTALANENLQLRSELWDDALEPAEPAAFDRLLEQAGKTIDFLRDGAPWQLLAVQAGRDGASARREWDSLVEKIEATWTEVVECRALIMEHGPEISDPRPAHELLPVIEEMIAHREAGGSFGLMTKLTHRAWFELPAQIRVGKRPLDPSNPVHLSAVRALLRLSVVRTELVERWGRQMTPHGGLASAELGAEPEQVCKQYVPQLRACLDWQTAVWEPLEKEFARAGFRWPRFLDSTAPEPGANAELRRIRRAVLGDLGPILQSRAAWLRHKRLTATWQQWQELAPESDQPEAAATRRLRRALHDGATDDYDAACEELARLKSLEPGLARRRELLARLAHFAPAWASALENRLPAHSQAQPPGGDVAAAWEWRQFHDELEKRAAVSLDQLQQRIERHAQRLLEVTAQLVEKQTWLNQIRLTAAPQKQALGAYAAMRNKLTKTGKGPRDTELRSAARREMATAKDAVPVWIMPLTEVADTFDPRRTRFDVVIIDEASQCDPTALFALYLGHQAVIVGDDEQVSPVAVGEKSDDVTKLISAYLDGVPRKELYDGSTSIYDLAQIAFGGVIRLTEHFRCAPDIIAFSNSLSYKGEIRPLREASSVPLSPHVVHYRVMGGRDAGDSLNAAEAESIAALICAAIEQPEYAENDAGEPTTFGVVSLVGDKQAVKIDALLRARLEPAEYRRRQILCGDSAQFQGDERDVMFLSLVDSPAGSSPLPMRQEGPKKVFKKRFNVAASRARNQLWVVHSLDHETDLQTGDYRRRLIEHARDPAAWEREAQKHLARAETRADRFDGAVLHALRVRGYHVIPRYQAGAYCIDLVVLGNGRRLAIECDGDQFHDPEKLREDLERQAVLERLGWTFVRVRGSLFFRDEPRALEPVFRRLRELGIAPDTPHGVAEGDAAQSEVIDRITRRAEELCARWRKSAASG